MTGRIANRPILSLVVALMSVAIGPQVSAQSHNINVGDANKLAMNGYDVMSYWRSGKPVKGNPQISFNYNGARWVFASEKNLKEFIANPESYAPQYGGYCAYAASLGKVADVDPFAWRVYKDKLYLNYNRRVRQIWSGNIDENVAKADAFWPEPLLTETK